MPNESHIEQLSHKHASLEIAISQEKQRPIPDAIRITDLKRKKLRIKDEINRLHEAD